MLEKFFGRLMVRAGGVQQTGVELNAIWRYSFKKIRQSVVLKPSVLMLGLGAGGALKDLYTLFPGSSITTVEYDPIMVHLALELQLYKPYPLPKIIEGDAGDILPTLSENFDLIVIDLFQGSKVSSLISQESFLTNLKKILSPRGIILINVFREPQCLEAARRIFTHSSHWKYTSNTIGAFWDYSPLTEHSC